MSEAIRDLDRREMFVEIKRLCRPNNFTNGFVLLREWVVYALVVACCLAWYQWTVAHGWSIWWVAPAYAASVFIIAVWVQNRLACLVHEASHYMVFKNRVLNEIASNAFVAIPARPIARFAAWRNSPRDGQRGGRREDHGHRANCGRIVGRPLTLTRLLFAMSRA